MEGSAGNYSGASYPPALYDTSVSSASASWRNASPLQGSYSEMEDPQFNQYPNDYHHQQRGHTMYSRSPRSFDTSRYKYNRDITAMSDPGGTMPEQNFQHRSHVEYAQSEIGSPSTRYYEPQQRSHKPIRYYEEERHREPNHQHSQNRYSSVPSPRRKSISPPLEQQRSESPMLQPMFSDDGEIIRDNYGRGHEGHHDGMYKSSPSYNRRSLDSSNIKEMQRQLWNNKRDPSPPRYNNGRIQQSLSPERRRQGSAPPSTNISRYARSLSPRRRQYQQSSPMAKESPSQIRKASSTMSDTSYNSRFNSKFVAAALEAQKRGDGNNNEVEELQRHQVPQYQQQREHRNQSFSSRPLNESDSKQHRIIPTSSPVHYSYNQNGDAHRKVPQYHRVNDNYVNTSRGSSEIRQRPAIPPSPSSSSSPSITNNGRQDRHQQKHFVPVDRGRSKESPQFRKNDLSARKIRPPSPLLLDRIKSFDHEYYNDSTRAVSDVREQGYDRRSARHDHQPVSNDGWRGMKYPDNNDNKNGHEATGRNTMRNPYIANEEDVQRPPQERFQNDRINHHGRNGYSSELSSPSVNRENNMNGGSHSKFQQIEMKGSRDMAGEIEKDRMASLVDKLSAVNRANPQSALAQIDSILKEESRSSHSQSYGNSNDLDNTKDVKLQQSHESYPESNLAEREFEDNGEDDNNDEEEDDDSSDVSSITNPTFQPGTSNSKYTKNLDSLYIQGDDRYNMHSTAPNNNLGFNPSTSSFRRPRPSHLQNYSNDASKDPNTMSRSEWKRQQLQTFPPPSTIKVKDDQDINGDPLQDSADVRERMLQKNMKIEASRSNQSSKVSRQPDNVEASRFNRTNKVSRQPDKVEAFRANKNNKVSRAPEKPRITQDKPKKKLDRFINDKQELAEKIRGWDELSNQELSNQMSNSRSEQEANKEVRQNIAAFSKQHPWDSANIQTKDTSMENADGIEASLSTRTHAFGSYMRELDVEAEISVGGSRAPSNTQANYFASARKNIKDKSGTNPFADDSVESNEKHAHTRNRYPDFPDPEFPDLDQLDSNAIPNVAVSMNGIPQFNPSGQQQYPSSNRDKKKSEGGEGGSWVEMPPSSFFPDVNEDFVPITSNSKPSRKPRVVSKLQDKDLEDGDPRSIARLACKTVAPKEPKVKEKKRGKLNFFMKKKKNNPRSVGYTASASGGSMSGMSVSLESRGVKSASHVPSSSRPIPQSNFQILAPPPGVSAVVKNAPSGRPGQQNASSTRRGRSKSSEKFRSSNMAKKFNRVMQLYDDDDY